MSLLIQPHGGRLTENRISTDEFNAKWKTILPTMKSWVLSQRQLCDVEMLMNGGFSPLTGFMQKKDYDNVLESMRLENGHVWPMPITLDVGSQFAKSVEVGEFVVLCDHEGTQIAILKVEEKWQPDKILEAQKIFGTKDLCHPGVHYLLKYAGDTYLGGRLFGITLPKHYDFKELRYTPNQLRNYFKEMNWSRIVGFQTRNPMHRAHQELTWRAAKQCEANLLIHPVVGMTKPGDVDHYTRVRCYKKLINHYPAQTTLLSLLPLAMRMGGPREALWHALIRKNYGCSHFIVGRDHAGPGKNSEGLPFYEPYAAQELVNKFQSEIEIKMVPFQEMVFVKERAQYIPVSQANKNETILKISGTEFRKRLREGLDIPNWFSYPDILTELRHTYPPKSQQGFTLFFTGLSGAGKSTIANAVLAKLMEVGDRQITLLDGDIVRKNLSSELGFSREHRDLNIQRIGFVATEITKNRGIAICAPIAPYKHTRQQVRETISRYGGFIEIYVSTALSVCEQRDPKGLYAKARANLIQNFTGISDPYEKPDQPDIEIDTGTVSVDEAVRIIFLKLENLGYLSQTPASIEENKLYDHVINKA